MLSNNAPPTTCKRMCKKDDLLASLVGENYDRHLDLTTLVW